jgi:WD40 repeat protein
LQSGTAVAEGRAHHHPGCGSIKTGARTRFNLERLSGSDFPVSGRHFGRSGLLAFGREDGKIEVWDWQNPSRKALLEGHQAQVLTLAFSPDGRTLVSGDEGGLAKVWEVSTHRELAALTNHSGWVGSLSFSPDGKTLATASADQTVRLWSTESWEEITTLRGHEFEVWWVAYSPDGRWLITPVWHYSGLPSSSEPCDSTSVSSRASVARGH